MGESRDALKTNVEVLWLSWARLIVMHHSKLRLLLVEDCLVSWATVARRMEWFQHDTTTCLVVLSTRVGLVCSWEDLTEIVLCLRCEYRQNFFVVVKIILATDHLLNTSVDKSSIFIFSLAWLSSQCTKKFIVSINDLTLHLLALWRSITGLSNS